MAHTCVVVLLVTLITLASVELALAGDVIDLFSKDMTMQLCDGGRTICSVKNRKMFAQQQHHHSTGRHNNNNNNNNKDNFNFVVRDASTGFWPPLFSVTLLMPTGRSTTTVNSSQCDSMKFTPASSATSKSLLVCNVSLPSSQQLLSIEITVNGARSSLDQYRRQQQQQQQQQTSFVTFGPIRVTGNATPVVSFSLPSDVTLVPDCASSSSASSRFPSSTTSIFYFDEGDDDVYEYQQDSLVFPASSGIVLPQPSAWPLRSRNSFLYPGKAALQFMCRQCYQQGGLYIATLDVAAHAKQFEVQAFPKRFVALSIKHIIDTTTNARSVVLVNYSTAFTMLPQMQTWHDAADTYRAWAEADQVPWLSHGTLLQRDNVPDFLKDGKGVVGAIWSIANENGFNPSALGPNLELLPSKVSQMKQRAQVGHFIAPVYGWEHDGTWAGIDYLPPLPSYGSWLNVSGTLLENGDAAAILVSGYWWVVKRQQTSGGPAFDHSAQVASKRDMLIKKNASGSLFEVDAYNDPHGRQSWRGLSVKLCMGHPNSTQTMTDIFSAIANDMNIPIVSFDQTIGGGQSEPCYDPSHPHPPGVGKFSWDGFEETLKSIRAKANNKKLVLMMEQCSEHAIPYTGTYWSRQFAPDNFPFGRARPKGMFSYIYHEYTTALAAALVQGVDEQSEFSKIKAMANSVARGLILCPFEFHLQGSSNKKKNQYATAYYSYAQAFGKSANYLINGRAVKPPMTKACEIVTVTGKGGRNMTFCAVSVGSFSSPQQQQGYGNTTTTMTTTTTKTFVASAVPHSTFVVLESRQFPGVQKNVTIDEPFGVVDVEFS